MSPRLQLRHTAHARLLPSREDLLDALPKNGLVAEIGVDRGDFAAEILRRCEIKRLHLVDAWIGERYGPGLDAVRERFAGEIAERQVEIHRGMSAAVLEDFPDGYFDWVYLDTDHEFATTTVELHICRRKVRRGGLIAGHDFCIGNVRKQRRYGVIEAVNAFCLEHDWGYAYLTLETHGHFSFCVRAL